MAVRGSAWCTRRPFRASKALILALCGRHPLQRREAVHVVDEILQSDLCLRPHNSD